MAYRITNISTTNLAMADGANLAPGQSTVVQELSANLHYLVAHRALSTTLMKTEKQPESAIVSAPVEPEPERPAKRKYRESE